MSIQQDEIDQRNLVTYAQRLAAKATKTDEPWGQTLPEEVWKEHLPRAQRWVDMRVTQRINGYNNVTISGTCPPETTVKDVEECFYHSYFGGRHAWAKDGKFGCTIHTD